MIVSQREITEAYLRGEDIRITYQRRVRAALLVCAVPAFFVLYAVKSALGIDLFDFHLWDLL